MRLRLNRNAVIKWGKQRDYHSIERLSSWTKHFTVLWFLFESSMDFLRSFQIIITTCGIWVLTKEKNENFSSFQKNALEKIQQFSSDWNLGQIVNFRFPVEYLPWFLHFDHKTSDFDTIGIIAQDKLSVNFRYFKAFKVSFSYSQDPDDKNVRSNKDQMSDNWNSYAIEDLSPRRVS